jgi:hypothetical protein
MSDSDMIPLGAAIAADVLAAFHFPGGATLARAADAHLAKKRREAADILIEEISQGYHGPISFEEHDLDPLIETILRFSKAVSEGAARENLRFLAQVIAGLKKNRALDGDAFRKWSGILEHLTRDELLVVDTSHVIAKRIAGTDDDTKDNFWKQLKSALQQAGYQQGEVAALCASVTRTGLLSPGSAFGEIAYTPTPWLEQLGGLADLEAATKREK